MLDDFRQQADTGFSDEAEEERDAFSLQEENAKPRSQFLGMTPAQRFIIAFMLLGLACLLSTFCLLVTQKVVPPLFY